MNQAKIYDNFDESDFEMDYIGIGSRIRAQRKKMGLSQAILAEMVEISTTHMSHIETGTTKLSLVTFVRLTESLNVSADSLLFPPSDNIGESLVARINRCIDMCDTKELSIVCDIVESTVASLKKNHSQP